MVPIQNLVAGQAPVNGEMYDTAKSFQMFLNLWRYTMRSVLASDFTESHGLCLKKAKH
jgi:hypothetical protein